MCSHELTIKKRSLKHARFAEGSTILRNIRGCPPACRGLLDRKMSEERINHHAGTPSETNTIDTMSLDTVQLRHIISL